MSETADRILGITAADHFICELSQHCLKDRVRVRDTVGLQLGMVLHGYTQSGVGLRLGYG